MSLRETNTAGVYTSGLQRRVRVIYLRGVRALFCAVSRRRGGTCLHGGVFGREGSRRGCFESFLLADGMCGSFMARGVSVLLPTTMWTFVTDNGACRPSRVLPYTGILVLGIGDALASVVGKRLGRYRWSATTQKTLEGSAALVCAVVGCAWLLRICGLVERFSVCHNS
jgi:hypothetical protein